MTKPVSCTNEVLLLVKFEKSLSRGHRVEPHEKAEVGVSSEISINTIFHLGLGNAFERVHYSVSDSTFNNFLYVWLFGECKDCVNLF